MFELVHIMSTTTKSPTIRPTMIWVVAQDKMVQIGSRFRSSSLTFGYEIVFLMFHIENLIELDNVNFIRSRA